MTWIGLRDRHGGQFRPAGLDAPARCFAIRSEDSPLARGSLQIECRYSPGAGATPLLHFDTEDPWPVRVTIFFDAAGTLHLGHRVCGRGTWLKLAPGLQGPTEGLVVTYLWDAPARKGWLGLYHPESGLLCASELQGPMPLALRDARRLATDGTGVRIGPNVDWLAVADDLVPLGPMPGLSGAVRIAVPGGKLRLDQIEPGQIVTTPGGGAAQVRWVGAVDRIARGRQAPLRLRAPFHSLEQDIEVARDQRLVLGGSDVEYLFGVEEVSAAAGHLVDQRSVLPAPERDVMRYWQVLLDRPAAILAEGCAVGSFDAGPIEAVPEVLPLTVLADLPRELMPSESRAPLPVLQGYEAMTLAYSGAA